MPIKLGIVGTNFISDRLWHAVQYVPEVEVCAVYSRHQETGDAFAAKYGITQVHTDYELFLESDLDAVYIATPTYAHCPQTLKALEHGKHVLCEKIMAVNANEAEQMIECAKKNQVILLEAMRPAFDPAYQLIMENLPKIGKLRRVTLEYCQYSSRYDKFRQGEILNAFRPELANGAIMDIGVYPIYMLVQLFGMPKDIKSFSTKLENGFEGDGIVLMQYEEMVAEAVYSKITESVNPSVFLGEDGAIVLDHVGVPEKIEIRYRDGRTEEIPYQTTAEREDGRGDNMQFEVAGFACLIREKNVEHPYLQHTLHTLQIADEARKQNGIVFDADLVL